MMQPLFRTWTVALASSALVAIFGCHVFAQATSGGSRHQETARQQILISKCPTAVSRAWENLGQTMRLLKTQFGLTNCEQATTQAQARLAKQEMQIFWPHDLRLMLTEETNGSVEAGRKITRGASLVPGEIILPMMKDDKTLSRAERNTREGHGMLERGQEILMKPRL
jgi:hypothetical protein